MAVYINTVLIGTSTSLTGQIVNDSISNIYIGNCSSSFTGFL